VLSVDGRHARDLLTAIEGLLERAAIGRDRLRGIGVAVGPGSFTGVRIGMATAKGLGFALDIPVEGLSTLEALARAAAGAGAGPGPVCAVLDAGRGEVYAALFDVRPGSVERRQPDRAWRPVDLAAAIPDAAALAGDGMAALPADARQKHAVVDPPLLGATLAAWVAEVAPGGGRYRAGGLGPNYVRPSDVEASRRNL
jgi:tRNA threonylcarbamoyladenosine biosynthesis protein TsaB